MLAVATTDLYLFTRQFAAMIGSRLPLVKALDNLSRETPNRRLRTVLEEITEDVYAGEDLSLAIERHQHIFGDIYVSIVRAGMSSGELGAALTHLTAYLQKVDELRKKLKFALLYPGFVCGMFFVVFNVMVFLILPRFQAMYGTLNRDLPELTQTMMAIGDFYIAYWPYLFGLVALLAGLFMSWVASEDGRHVWDETKIRLPLVGTINRNAVLSRFLWTFAVQLKNQIPAIQALRLAAGSAHNVHVRAVIHDVADQVEHGSTMADAFRDSEIFGDVVVQMIATGEEAGTLDSLLLSTAGYFDSILIQRINGMMSLVNPILTALVGLGIAAMLIAAFLPVFEMSGNLS